MTEITCISSGLFIRSMTGGRSIVWPVIDAAKLPAVMEDDLDLVRMVCYWPRIGLVRDFRRATMDQVCNSLLREGKEFIRSDSDCCGCGKTKG
jgi:hypothetical protein